MEKQFFKLLVFIVWFTLSFPEFGATLSVDAPAARIALLATDASDGATGTLVDLLYAKLSQHEKIQLVERADIERIMAEHNLSAAGLTGAKERIELGKLLKADGFFFVSKSANNDRITARLVETRQGFQACYFIYPFSDHKLDGVADQISGDLDRTVHKLALDPAERQLVSILRIGNATMRPELLWIEDELPLMLNASLTFEPGLLVLERRQMRELAEEAKRHAVKKSFVGSGVMIDGELALTLGAKLTKKDLPVTLTLRLRDADLLELDRVSVEGKTENLEVMAAEAVARVLEKLRKTGKQISTAMPRVESGELLNIARKHKLLWAAESSYALAVTNAEFPVDLVERLLSSGENTMERVSNIARASKICHAAGVRLMDYMSPRIRSGKLDRFVNLFMQPDVMLNPEMRALLKPVRKKLRIEVESMPERTTDNMLYKTDTLIRTASAFFDNPLDYEFYTKSWFDLLDSDAANQAIQVIMINECLWSPEQFESLRSHNNAIFRYFANIRLARFNYAKKRQDYCLSALEELPEVLNEKKGLARVDLRLDVWSGRHLCRRTYDYFNSSIKDLTNACPDKSDFVFKRIYNHFEILLEEKALPEIVAAAPDKYLDQIGPERMVPWIDGFLAHYDDIIEFAGQQNFRVRAMLNCLAEYSSKHFQFRVPDISGNPRARVLMSVESPAWQNTGGTLYPKSKYDERFTGFLTPQYLFPDNDVLWVGLRASRTVFSGRAETRSHAIGMMKIDFSTGNIMAMRYVKQPDQIINHTGEIILPPTYLDQGVRRRIPLFEWNNYIGLASDTFGLFLFPRDMRGVRKSLDDVIVLEYPENFKYNTGAVVSTDSAIFLAVGEVVVKYDMVNHCSSIIGDSTREIDGLALPGAELHLDDLFWNESRNTLCAVTKVLYGFKPKIDGRQIRHSVWEYQAHDGSWICLSNSPKSYHRPHPWFSQLGDKSDAKREGWVSDALINSEPHRFFSALPKGLGDSFDIWDYRDGTLAISGAGRDWKLCYFTRDSSPGNGVRLHHSFADETSVKTPVLSPFDKLLRAIEAGDLDQVAMLADGVNLNMRNEDGTTPLRWAIVCEKPVIVQWLLEQKVAFDDIGVATGRTPLLVAAQRGNLEIVKLLVKAGANLNATDKWNNPIFVIAARAPDSSVIEWLFEHKKPDTSVLNRALFHAVGWWAKDNVIWLIEHGADVNGFLDEKTPLLCHAVESTTPEILKLLLESGADLNIKAKWSDWVNTPLKRLITFNRRPDNLRVLYEYGAELDVVIEPHTQPEFKFVIMEAVGHEVLRRFGYD